MYITQLAWFYSVFCFSSFRPFSRRYKLSYMEYLLLFQNVFFHFNRSLEQFARNISQHRLWKKNIMKLKRKLGTLLNEKEKNYKIYKWNEIYDKWTISLLNVMFTTNERKLVEKGLKYALLSYLDKEKVMGEQVC